MRAVGKQTTATRLCPQNSEPQNPWAQLVLQRLCATCSRADDAQSSETPMRTQRRAVVVLGSHAPRSNVCPRYSLPQFQEANRLNKMGYQRITFVMRCREYGGKLP
jgi:hypothetical protein